MQSGKSALDKNFDVERLFCKACQMKLISMKFVAFEGLMSWEAFPTNLK